ncbi:exopolysaccharide biosynthesis protein [Halomonas qinghailakensis]|uniref:Exopolysaccharide biosynthesis protein n=2 Tax=Halomonas TaxID=2745 RepID=A0AA46YS88_9GAMM|nr:MULTISPECIES: exopolysaccharide biosynthesis protein [Halomonas]UYO76235.1 exopolysaccharide biosynthesis protein [Halomonas sp. ZZQ-149]UYV18865.1 exopolysaccharide biosynthesis protein [Halomonas qaidamensis]
MSDMQDASNLTELINTMERMEREKAKVSVDDVVHAVGRRSFGPLLLVAGLITLAPIIGDIPGMPTLMAVLVVLTSVQLLIGRETFWLPKWLTKRSISREKFDKAIRYMKKPAKWVDSLLGVRLAWMTGYIGIRVTAVMCLLIALAMPPMEFIPFSANGAGLALTLFGLGLVARDGIMLSLGFLLTGVTFTVVLINVL